MTMRRIIVYAAISLNGMIAKKNHDLHWLESIPNPDKTDYGYGKFIKSIDSTIQGYKTYKVVKDKGVSMPTKDLNNYVFTHKQDRPNEEYVTFVSKDHLHFIRELKKQAGKDIWLIGGGQINTFFLNHKLIDELIIFVMPVIIENGIKLFEEIPIDQNLKLLESSTYASGAIQLRYSLK